MTIAAIETDWIADCVDRLRSRRPRVHCLTNDAAQAFTANVLLAAGAIPSLTIAAAEIGHFVGRADALLVNLGTFDEARRTAAGIAIDAATGTGKPFVLDPVLVDVSPYRRALAEDLIARRPAILRSNAAEFAALSGRHADADALRDYAAAHRMVVAISGAVDVVTDGERSLSIENGDPLMTRITAAGCALGALMAAFAAVEDDPLKAAVASLAMIGVAGAEAGRTAAGPGSFAVGLLDALANLSPTRIAEEARIA